jgi:hypothetical protein
MLVPVLAAVLSGAVFAGASALAPNLLTNGDFSAGATGWSLGGGVPGTLTPNPDGTLSITNKSDPASTSLATAVQCLNTVNPGVAYTLKADVYVPAGQARHGGGHTRVTWWSGPNCTGSIISNPFGSQFVTTKGAWVATQTVFVAPAATKSARVMIGTEQYKVDPGEDPNAYFVTKWDNVSFRAAEAVVDTPPTILPTITAVPTVFVPPTVVPPTVTATVPTATATVPTATATVKVTTPSSTPSPTTTSTREPVTDATETPGASPTATQEVPPAGSSPASSRLSGAGSPQTERTPGPIARQGDGASVRVSECLKSRNARLLRYSTTPLLRYSATRHASSENGGYSSRMSSR